ARLAAARGAWVARVVHGHAHVALTAAGGAAIADEVVAPPRLAHLHARLLQGDGQRVDGVEARFALTPQRIHRRHRRLLRVDGVEAILGAVDGAVDVVVRLAA